MEGFKQKIEEGKTLEPRDQEISDKLNSLEINYEYFISNDEQEVMVRKNIERVLGIK